MNSQSSLSLSPRMYIQRVFMSYLWVSLLLLLLSILLLIIILRAGPRILITFQTHSAVTKPEQIFYYFFFVSRSTRRGQWNFCLFLISQPPSHGAYHQMKTTRTYCLKKMGSLYASSTDVAQWKRNLILGFHCLSAGVVLGFRWLCNNNETRQSTATRRRQQHNDLNPVIKIIPRLCCLV